ncbi:polysialyltransferase family glycosyltransferase [Paeniglutamicibacter kerguelensis]|uniref:UDP-N-acetylglucosamine 2-epimerase domain-containing protein n=1 Tax=Paeniglutamicibacter kerguelensis TaxID=254788 RepID=A0ABS4XIC4_9MICC|nr:polysialyltransferase family glycosyltransferase [Paeniglutamicibacter kerguelensis]MBP2388222.1 hypothetical protein [Paeniglutamicibacter kerguelensis]
MIQLVAASTAYQVASLVAMIDSGTLPAPDGRRILVLADGSQLPELTTPITESAGFAELATRFDAVVDLGALVWPRRPHQFGPRAEELGMWETLLRSHWSLGTEPLQLVVESIQVNPAIALCRIFHDATVFIHSDGLMSYGPSRNRVEPAITQRLEGIVYPDLVPGLVPLLLSEAEPRLLPMDPTHLASVFEDLAGGLDGGEIDALVRGSSRCVLVLGQYLNNLGLIDEDGERVLHEQMLAEAKSLDADLVVFKPHPAASPTAALRLGRAAGELGLQFEVCESALSAELVALKIRPVAIVSAFSTALVTCSRLFGFPARAVGTSALLQQLAPFENSNRIPLTLVDAMFVRGTTSPAALQGLVDAVSYGMQPDRLPHLRDASAAYLRTHPVERGRYFKQRRLHRLNLPNTLPARPSGKRLREGFRRAAKRSVQRPATFLRRQLDRAGLQWPTEP